MYGYNICECQEWHMYAHKLPIITALPPQKSGERDTEHTHTHMHTHTHTHTGYGCHSEKFSEVDGGQYSS